MKYFFLFLLITGMAETIQCGEEPSVRYDYTAKLDNGVWVRTVRNGAEVKQTYFNPAKLTRISTSSEVKNNNSGYGGSRAGTPTNYTIEKEGSIPRTIQRIDRESLETVAAILWEQEEPNSNLLPDGSKTPIPQGSSTDFSQKK